MISNTEDLRLDIEELQTLLMSSKRTNVKNLLENQIKRISDLLEAQETSQPQPVQNDKIVDENVELKNSQNVRSDAIYQPINDYLMDQEGSTVNFSSKRVHGEILENQCKFVQKANKIIVTLIKAKSGHWSQLAYKENKFNQDKYDKGKDPQESLMDMMKNLYQDGDENMKRTIAEAWVS